MVWWCWVNFWCWGVLRFRYSRARAFCTCSRCGWGLFGIFTLIYPFSPLSPSLWEAARYRLKYCLKGPLKPNQPTNLQCRGVLLIWIKVGQGPIALAIGADEGCLDIFSLVSLFFLPLWETARYWLKHCLKGPLNPKHPTNQPTSKFWNSMFVLCN